MIHFLSDRERDVGIAAGFVIRNRRIYLIVGKQLVRSTTPVTGYMQDLWEMLMDGETNWGSGDKEVAQ